MKGTTYKIWFANSFYYRQSELVEAMNVDAAIILAKAVRIRAGLDYTVESIEIIED